ncbi:molybdopterin-synthase adenylyltransferase MoeB [Asticcacaulis sp. BYS171W]|uniref:Molybdopterin-synthase adenylyltransferase MoeB n=1 Tax=Asticcacaulis aquaticus TaxID=2984212 RepID=A0ABT5HTH6_9CAUL|nr:molybdopterin-synthase adenylyltransferase MoeB [Asticcacaulis aquaticus]MDC7683339.1 molybdopterin-synthase adenylyltransferase MoeB [Asticcacaulis aquaticus]
MTQTELTDDDLDRYARHIVLKEIGGLGQMRLKGAKVLIVGMGGIGAPAALYLAAAGVGTLGLLDDDTVSLSNLQRQVLYATGDIDAGKAETAQTRLSALNPHADLFLHPVRLTEDNAAEIIAGYDIVLDGCDNFETRHLVNRVCMAERKTLVSGALGRWSGQVAVFRGQPCYQCFVPDIPPDAETCERVGVVGALAGIIGSICALEVVKLITTAGEPLIGKLLLFDGLSMTSRVIGLPSEPTCPVCGSHA